MLALNPDIVRAVIDRAREFQAQDTVVFPDSDGGGRGNLMSQELSALIDDLEPDQQAALVALTWIGRGDYGADEWDDAYDEAKDSWNEDTARYLMAIPMLADYLSEGLAEFGYEREE